MSNSLQPHECSLPGSSVLGDSPGKNTGVGCHALLQGIFPIQGSNLNLLCLLHWQVSSLPLAKRWIGCVHIKSIICPLRGTYFPIFIPILIQKAIITQHYKVQPMLTSLQWHPTPVLLPGKSHGWTRN